MRYPAVFDGTAYTRRIHPIECRITENLQPLSKVDMVLPPEDEISVYDWVEVPKPDGASLWCRVASVQTDSVTGEKSVYLEHGACIFDDILIPETGKRKSASWNKTVSQILADVISKQSRWTAGTVTPTDTVYIEPGDKSLMTILLTMMKAIPDYQIEFVQQSASDWHINIVARPATPVCECRLSRNLESCEITYDAENLVTRVYSDQLTGGKMDSLNTAVYGIHEETISLNENLSASQKQSVASAYLQNHDHPSVGIGISALELSQITGLTFDKFVVGTVCRVAVPWLGITENEVIISKSYEDPYTNPEAVRIELANATPDLSILVAAVTGGGGGGSSKGKSGLLTEKKRFETRFDQTDEYFKLIATETEWNSLEQGTVTAYGQIVLTTTRFEAVVYAIGDNDGTITAASIALAINAQGSNAYINADHIYLNAASEITLSGIVQVNGTTFIIEEGYTGDGTLEVNTVECSFLDNHTISSEIITASDYISTDGLVVDGDEAVWMSQTVCTGVTVTFPSFARTYKYFVYADNNDMSDLKTYYGAVVSQYSDGRATPNTDTIYYLGRSASS